MALFSDDIAFKTIIGEGSSIRGNLSISGMVRIEGDIDGDIETTGSIFISERARIRGNITAKAVTVCGIVCGNITAPESVQLYPTSAVIGDIQTHRLRADENVIIQGHCIALSDGEAYEKASAQQDDARAIASRAILEPIRIQAKQEEPGEAGQERPPFTPISLGKRIR